MYGYDPPPVPGFQPGNPQGYGPRGPSDDQTWSLLAYPKVMCLPLVH